MIDLELSKKHPSWKQRSWQTRGPGQLVDTPRVKAGQSAVTLVHVVNAAPVLSASHAVRAPSLDLKHVVAQHLVEKRGNRVGSPLNLFAQHCALNEGGSAQIYDAGARLGVVEGLHILLVPRVADSARAAVDGKVQNAHKLDSKYLDNSRGTRQASQAARRFQVEHPVLKRKVAVLELPSRGLHKLLKSL
jgi:hypothetical protein